MRSLDANRFHNTRQERPATPEASMLAVDQAVLRGPICENCGAHGLLYVTPFGLMGVQAVRRVLVKVCSRIDKG